MWSPRARNWLIPKLNIQPWLRIVDKLAKRNGVTVLGTGVNPGFIMDTIVMAASGVCQEIKRIKVTHVVEAGERRLPLQRKIGAGLTMAEFEERVATAEIGHVGLTESATMVTHALGWQLDSVEASIEPVIAEKPLKSRFITIKEGQVAGVHQVARGIKGDEELIVLDLYISISVENPRDSVVIEGTPSIKLTLEGVHGDLATVAMAVNAVPRVVSAPPAVLTMKDLPLVRASLGKNRANPTQGNLLESMTVPTLEVKHLSDVTLSR